MAYNRFVVRHWSSFNQEITNREFREIPSQDRADLFEAMKMYRLDTGIGYVVKHYGNGLMMIKPKDGQGRCLFFCVVESEANHELVALLAYKKESQKLPERLRKLATERMNGYRGNE